MRPANQVLANNRNQEEFPPLLEQSAREVFQIMLGCELDPPTEVPSPESFEFTAMVGLAAWWNWLKHARPRAAVWVSRATVVALFGGVIF